MLTCSKCLSSTKLKSNCFWRERPKDPRHVEGKPKLSKIDSLEPLVFQLFYLCIYKSFSYKTGVTKHIENSSCSNYSSYKEKRVTRQCMFDLMNHLSFMQCKLLSFKSFIILSLKFLFIYILKTLLIPSNNTIFFIFLYSSSRT